MRGIDFYSYRMFIRAAVVAFQNFKNCHGFLPSLDNPRTFNENILFRKLFAEHRMPSLSNKLASREYVRRLLGDRFVTEISWVGKTVDGLWTFPIPPGRYFLKANHGSGFNLQLDLPKDLVERRDEIINVTRHWMETKFNLHAGEWQYSTYEPRLFLEKFLDLKGDSAPDDYKFYCFDGKPKMILYIDGRFVDIRRSYFDTAWTMYPVTVDDEPPRTAPVEKPILLSEMLRLASEISKEFDFVRVDFYSDGKRRIVFGELTFTPGDSLNKFSDPAFDLHVGALFKELGR